MKMHIRICNNAVSLCLFLSKLTIFISLFSKNIIEHETQPYSYFNFYL